MNRYERYIYLSAEIINHYDGTEPFANFLKKYFSTHKQLGSRDRKQISACCYAYFRTGQLLNAFELLERIPLALFLCSNQSEPLLSHLFSDLNNNTNRSLKEKCSMKSIDWSEHKVFPWINAMSEGIDRSLFVESHFVQPGLFVRIRPGKQNLVLHKLHEASIAYHILNDHCIEFQNGLDLSKILNLNHDVVIQDYSSQRLADFFANIEFPQDQNISVWDSCAASGGKSILCKDYFPNAQLTVSDVRPSILKNLSIRFKEAGITYKYLIAADLAQSVPQHFKEKKYDFIIADVPCTGSGTWSRTPEWLHFFNEDKISSYVSLQQKILGNIIPHINEGGFLLYSTCSVFSAENEAQIQYIQQRYNLLLIRHQIIEGYQHKADTMFGALFKKI